MKGAWGRSLALAAAVGLCPATAAMADPLTAAQIRTEVIGQSFEARRMGLSMQIRFYPDGRVEMTAPLMRATGRWHLSGDALCTTFETGPRRGESCATLTDMGGGAVETSDGLVLRPRR